MGLNTPPLIEMPTTICGHCSRDNYGSLDSTCKGCGAPVRKTMGIPAELFGVDSNYSSARVEAAIFEARVSLSPPPTPPSVSLVQY